MSHRVRFLPGDVVVSAEDGASLLETARRAGYMLRTECGGLGTCRRCKVRLLSGEVFTAGRPNLSAREQEQGFALACVSRVTGDVEVQIPPGSQFTFSREALPAEWSPGEHPGRELKALGLPLEPLAERLRLKVPPPTLQDNSSDFDRLCRALTRRGLPAPFQAGPEALRRLARTLRAHDGEIHVLLHRGAAATLILDLDADEPQPVYGLALDVGTTTLFARLIDLATGEVAAEASDFNAQIPCGADIIHRIVYAGRPGGLDELRKLILEATEALLRRMVKEVGGHPHRVVAAVVAGNATMQHLFLGLDPRTIREEPYVPTVTHFPLLSARDAGLGLHPRAPVLFSPSVASYVGGDITAGLVAAGVHRAEELCLYVDLGTNGEVALGNREWLTACACSAGPAFEGSGVRCGMRALPGAVDQVRSDGRGRLTFRVIGGGSPRGICGSGLIDLLAELRATGRLDARGKFRPEADPERLRRHGRHTELVLASEADTGGAGDLAISEVDLDNLVRTKGAIFAGIMTLLKGVGLEPGAIDRVIIAGGFGRYLDVERAVQIGMLPDLPREHFSYLGNGSLRGAGLALLSQRLRDELEEVARRVTYFELSAWPGYMDEFMAALFLPHTEAALFPSVKPPPSK
ncbi:MAG: DUF4445 domain-containing protein [Candidatus Zixiibacteriota bacterium]|nr:MAG: DUF4445 domain-containing protein [candidate division Zixibacteria bacterium]